MNPIRLLADLRESQADATVPSTPKPGDAHNPKVPLVWEWTNRRAGNGPGTGGGNQHHFIAPAREASVLGGAWATSPLASDGMRRVHFNYAFVDLAALIARRPGFENFRLREVLIEVAFGDDGLWHGRETFETWTPRWTSGQVAAASLSATVLLPAKVLYLGLTVEFKGEHHPPSSQIERAPLPFAPVLFAEIPISNIARIRTPPIADVPPILRPGT